MYPLDRGTLNDSPLDESLAKAHDVPGLPDFRPGWQRVTCRACGDLIFSAGSDEGQYVDRVSQQDKQYCCKDRDLFANLQRRHAEVNTRAGVKISTGVVDTLTDFGPVDRSKVGGPVRTGGITDSDGNFIFPQNRDKSGASYIDDANDEQKTALRNAWVNFVKGPCSHPCAFINNTRMMCPTRSCIETDGQNFDIECESYTTNTMAGCYCEALVTKKQAEGAGLFAYSDLVTDPVCRTYIGELVSGELFSILSLLMVSGVNIILTYLLRLLAYFQRPHHWSEYFSTASISIFWARFINVAFVIMVVNMESPGPNTYLESRFPGTFRVLRTFSILTGEHREFDAAWFQFVGTVRSAA